MAGQDIQKRTRGAIALIQDDDGGGAFDVKGLRGLFSCLFNTDRIC